MNHGFERPNASVDHGFNYAIEYRWGGAWFFTHDAPDSIIAMQVMEGLIADWPNLPWRYRYREEIQTWERLVTSTRR